jgi:hypothetical protein
VRIVAALCAFILGGCGLTSSPADGLTFRAPYGWQGTPGILGTAQIWHPPAQDGEVLMIVRLPIQQLDLSRATSQIDLQNASSREHVDSVDRIKICGNQPAVYMIGENFRKSVTGDVESHNRVVMSNLNGATYLAVYTYPMTAEPNGEALAALRQLCVKK